MTPERANKKSPSPVLEKLAALEHEQWITWANHILNGEPNLTKERVYRWRQFLVPYSRLTEEQKEQDRVWARKVLAALEEKSTPPREEVALEKKIWSKAHDAGFLPEIAIVIELTELEDILGLNFFGTKTKGTLSTEKITEKKESDE